MKNKKKTPFWRLSGADVQGISYLLGTMHLKPPGPKPSWEAPFLNYIDLCQVFATEFSLDEVDPVLLRKFSLLPDNQLLSDYLTEKKFKKLEKVLLKSLGLPLRSLIRMQPLMIVNLISEQLLAAYHPVSMDSELWQAAVKKGKRMEGIETFEEQLQILKKIPIDYQVKNLVSIIKNINQYRKKLLHLAKVYDTGDIQQLYKVSKQGMGSIRKLMLIDRNHIMAERIYDKIQTTSMFCAIGAGHLAGKEGVLRLLKKKGVTIKPILVK